jgi:hypothetical protein
MQDRMLIAIIILTLLNVPLYLWLGRAFFGGWQGFFDCIVFWFKPDLWSLLRGEWWDDMLAELKLGLFFTLCFLIVLAESSLLSPLLATALN